VEGAKVKIIFHVKMRGVYSQGWNWPLWLFDFPHDYLAYMTLQLYMWVSWTSTLHCIEYNDMAHSSDLAEMTHDMTQHNKAGMFKLLVVSISSYSVVEWWMCSWCIIASAPHGKVYGVFDGLGVHLRLHMHVSPSLVLGMLHVFICLWTSLLAFVPCSSHSSSHHVSSVYLYLQSLMMIQHQIQKYPILPWCIIFCFQMQVTRIEDEALKLHRAHFMQGCVLWALSMKIAQRSLGGWDGNSGSAVTVSVI